jgi:hypothetical protein
MELLAGWLGWCIAALEAGILIGIFAARWYVGQQPPKPTLLPYEKPVLRKLGTSPDPEMEGLINNGAAEMLKMGEPEIQAMMSDIMAESGCDAETARKEVALILAEASQIGQG